MFTISSNLTCQHAEVENDEMNCLFSAKARNFCTLPIHISACFLSFSSRVFASALWWHVHIWTTKKLRSYLRWRDSRTRRKWKREWQTRTTQMLSKIIEWQQRVRVLSLKFLSAALKKITIIINNLKFLSAAALLRTPLKYFHEIRFFVFICREGFVLSWIHSKRSSLLNWHKK